MTPSTPTLRPAAALLFVSGATALLYEVVWGKWLGNVLGNSGQAHAVVLAVFMLGLALGAWVFGGLADSSPRPLRLYAALEGGIAVYALAFPYVLGALSWLYLALGGGLLAKLFFTGLAVLPPTVLMGGTLLPVVRHATADVSLLRGRLALLYAVNALGAACGALLGGMVLMPKLGLSGTTWVAAALNVWVALAALVLSRRVPRAEALAEADPGEPTYGAKAVRAARAGAALSGFSAMALQVTWIRVLTLVLGASTYAFTLILTAFILGIGLGSLLLLKVRTRDALKVFGVAQLLVAVSVAAALPLYARLPYWMWQLSRQVEHVPANWPLFQLLSFSLCAALLLVPTTLLGASFPSVARVGAAQEQSMGKRLGGVYLWNTAGAVLGALLTGLWLMPAVSLSGCIAAALGASVLAGVLALLSAPSLAPGRWKALAAAAVATVATGGAFGAAGEWPRVLAHAGTFREAGAAPESFEAFRYRTLESDLELLRQDDTFATVVVGANRVSGTRFLRINGKIDASDSDDMSTQILLGQLGPLLHPKEVKTALVIGLGSGITLGSLLTHQSVERVDVVEISPAVIAGAENFSGANRDALMDPRVKMHLEDARTFLLLSGRKYDLIVSEPSNPWVAGVAGLFTREFFQLARAHLEAGGLLVQWQHLYETEPAMVQLVLRTVRDTFPHGTSWLGGLDLLMVASMDEVKPDTAKLEAVLQDWGVGADLGRIRAQTVPAMLALQVHSDQGQKDFAGDGPVNTDDRNLLEFGAPRAFFLHGPKVAVGDERADPRRVDRLALWQWKAGRVVMPLQAEAIHTSTLRAAGLDDPAVITAANEWLRLAPTDLGAKEAVAASALAQGNAALAVDLMREVVSAGAVGPNSAKRYADAVAKLEDTTHAEWTGTPAVLSVLKATMMRVPETPELTSAVTRFCRGVDRAACLEQVQALLFESPEAEPEQ